MRKVKSIMDTELNPNLVTRMEIALHFGFAGPVLCEKPYVTYGVKDEDIEDDYETTGIYSFKRYGDSRDIFVKVPVGHPVTRDGSRGVPRGGSRVPKFRIKVPNHSPIKPGEEIEATVYQGAPFIKKAFNVI